MKMKVPVMEFSNMQEQVHGKIMSSGIALAPMTEEFPEQRLGFSFGTTVKRKTISVDYFSLIIKLKTSMELQFDFLMIPNIVISNS